MSPHVLAWLLGLTAAKRRADAQSKYDNDADASADAGYFAEVYEGEMLAALSNQRALELLSDTDDLAFFADDDPSDAEVIEVEVLRDPDAQFLLSARAEIAEALGASLDDVQHVPPARRWER